MINSVKVSYNRGKVLHSTRLHLSAGHLLKLHPLIDCLSATIVDGRIDLLFLAVEVIVLAQVCIFACYEQKNNNVILNRSLCRTLLCYRGVQTAEVW